MKNFAIVFLGFWVIYLLLGKKKTDELFRQAQKKMDDITGKPAALTPEGHTPTTASNMAPADPDPVYYPKEVVISDTPVIDRPAIKPKQEPIMVIETPFSNYTPTQKKHGAFKLG